MVRRDRFLGLLGIVASSGVLIVSEQEQDKSSEKQMIVQGLLFVFVLIPAVFLAFSIFLSDYVAQTPPSRRSGDAARQAEIAACESAKGYKNTEDCYK